MKPNPLLFAVAGVYAFGGLALTFAPRELLSGLGGPPSAVTVLLGQLFGAALLGLAYLSWLQRYTKVGGIYGRPILLGNLTFAMPAFFAAARAWRHEGGTVLLASTVVLGAIAVAFGLRVFSPGRVAGSEP